MVYNLAGRLLAPGVPSTEYRRTHVEGTKLLIAHCREEPKLERFVQCSTTGVLGVTGNRPADEDTPLCPSNVYEATKAEAELAVRDAWRDGFPAVIARPGLVYGPGDLHLLGFFRSVVRRRFRPIGRTKVLLHPIYIDDLTEGLLRCGRRARRRRVLPPRRSRARCLPRWRRRSPRRRGSDRRRDTSLSRGPSRCGARRLPPRKPEEPAPLTRDRLDFLTYSRVYDVTRAQRLLDFTATTTFPTGAARQSRLVSQARTPPERDRGGKPAGLEGVDARSRSHRALHGECGDPQPWLGRDALGLWTGGVLIDGDHYVWFCLRERRLNPATAVRFFNQAQAPQHAATHRLHSPLVPLVVLLMGLRRPRLLALALGMAMHVALDRFHEGRMDRARAAALDGMPSGAKRAASGAPGRHAPPETTDAAALVRAREPDLALRSVPRRCPRQRVEPVELASLTRPRAARLHTVALRTAVGLCAGAILIVTFLRLIDVGGVLQRLEHLSIGFALLCGVVFLAAYVVRALRWRCLLRPCQVSVGHVVAIYQVATFLNWLLPIRAGEIAKSLMLRRTDGIPVSRSLATVSMDKAMDLLPAIGLLALLPFVPLHLSRALWALLISALVVVLLSAPILALAVWRRDRAMEVLTRPRGGSHPGRRERVEPFMVTFFDTLLALVRQPRLLLAAAGYTVVGGQPGRALLPAGVQGRRGERCPAGRPLRIHLLQPGVHPAHAARSDRKQRADRPDDLLRPVLGRPLGGRCDVPVLPPVDGHPPDDQRPGLPERDGPELPDLAAPRPGAGRRSAHDGARHRCRWVPRQPRDRSARGGRGTAAAARPAGRDRGRPAGPMSVTRATSPTRRRSERCSAGSTESSTARRGPARGARRASTSVRTCGVSRRWCGRRWPPAFDESCT